MAAITVTILATVAPLGSATLGQYSLQTVSSGSAKTPVPEAIVGMTSHGTQKHWHKATVEATASSVSAIPVVLASPRAGSTSIL